LVVRRVKLRRKILRVLAALAAVGFWIVIYVYLTLPDVRVLAATNPTNTAWMERPKRRARGGRSGRSSAGSRTPASRTS